MGLVVTIASVGGGLVCGGLAGLWLGEHSRSRRTYWAANALALIGCAALNFAGLVSGNSWLAYGALGLMGGLITGLKYGRVHAMGGWKDQSLDDASESADSEENVEETQGTSAAPSE